MLVKYVLSDGISQAFLPFRSLCWCNRHHRSWPFLECRPSKLYFKILWKYDDWSFRFHHFLENGWFYRENTYKLSALSLLQIASTKLYCYHSVIINVIAINRNQLLIVIQNMVVCSQSNILQWQKQKHQIHWIKYFIIWVSKLNVWIK